MKPMLKTWRCAWSSAVGLIGDRRGIAAIEFAMILPIMLVMFFGVVEFSSAVAVDRKVTLVARTLSDLTSQATTATDCTLSNSFAAANAVFSPYPATPSAATITELYIDPTTLKVTVQWSRSATITAAGTVALGAGRATGLVITTVPTALVVGGTYLIWSEVSYRYTPAVGYMMAKAGITLSDMAYTRPRQSNSVPYTVACS